MTEAEAKTRLCPLVMHRVMRATVANPDDTVIYWEPKNCIASGCMAWRVSKTVGIGPNEERRELDTDGLTKWVDDGFCGLAGKP